MTKLTGISCSTGCKQKGFGDKYMIWLKSDVTEGTLSIKVNDEVGPYFGSYKGVTQGVPFLSILLF
jgi:hypothetical protein